MISITLQYCSRLIWCSYLQNTMQMTMQQQNTDFKYCKCTKTWYYYTTNKKRFFFYQHGWKCATVVCYCTALQNHLFSGPRTANIKQLLQSSNGYRERMPWKKYWSCIDHFLIKMKWLHTETPNSSCLSRELKAINTVYLQNEDWPFSAELLILFSVYFSWSSSVCFGRKKLSWKWKMWSHLHWDICCEAHKDKSYWGASL